MEEQGHQKLTELSDEQLVSLYHQGENGGLVELVSRYLKTIDQKIRIYPYPVMDAEDVKQEALISLLHAVKTYSPERGAKFSTYAGICLDHSIQNSLAKASSKKRMLFHNALPIEHAQEAQDYSEAQNPEALYIDQERYRHLMDQIEEGLSEFEKSVLFCYLDGKSYSQISEELNSSQKAVDNALQRVRRKLKTVFKKSV